MFYIMGRYYRSECNNKFRINNSQKNIKIDMESRKRARTLEEKEGVECDIIVKKLEKLVKNSEVELKTIVSDTKTTLVDLNNYDEAYESLLKKIETNFQNYQNVVKLDIGGKVFKVSKELLMSLENTYFYGLLSNTDKFQTQQDGSFFIDRNPRVFDRILDYFRFGKLEVRELTEVSMDLLRDDFDYYCIPLPKELQSLQWNKESINFCYFSYDNLTVTRSAEKDCGVVFGNIAVDKFTVRINENGFLAIGFYFGPNHNICSNGWFIDAWNGDLVGIRNKLGLPDGYGPGDLIGIGDDDKFAFHYYSCDHLTAFNKGDYLTVIREGISIRFEKNKIDLGAGPCFLKIPNQSLFPAVVFFGENRDESVTFINDY